MSCSGCCSLEKWSAGKNVCLERLSGWTKSYRSCSWNLCFWLKERSSGWKANSCRVRWQCCGCCRWNIWMSWSWTPMCVRRSRFLWLQVLQCCWMGWISGWRCCSHGWMGCRCCSCCHYHCLVRCLHCPVRCRRHVHRGFRCRHIHCFHRGFRQVRRSVLRVRAH